MSRDAGTDERDDDQHRHAYGSHGNDRSPQDPFDLPLKSNLAVVEQAREQAGFTGQHEGRAEDEDAASRPRNEDVRETESQQREAEQDAKQASWVGAWHVRALVKPRDESLASLRFGCACRMRRCMLPDPSQHALLPFVTAGTEGSGALAGSSDIVIDGAPCSRDRTVARGPHKYIDPWST